MQPPRVLRIKVLSKQILPQKSKLFKVLEIYYKFQLILGCLDFGFFKWKSWKLKIFLKTLSVLSFIIFCIVILLTIDISKVGVVYFVRYCLILLNYLVTVLSLVTMSDNITFYSHFVDLEDIDFKLRIDCSSYNLEIKMIVISCLHISVRVVINLIFCAFGICNILSISHNWLLTFAHSVLISYSFVFYSINCRLKELVSILRSNSDLSHLQIVYKKIVDLAEAHAFVFAPIFVAAILYNIPVIMLLIYSAVQGQYKNGYDGVQLMLYFTAFEALVIVFAPAICAGMLATQSDQIHVILHEKLLGMNDESKTQEIERFIHYIKERDCRFRLYKMIPLNADLLGMVLNFCVTYLIVIIQFANK